MHTLEPYYNWRHHYSSEEDTNSPFYGREHSEFEYSDTIYNHYIHPQWDYFGSDTLYLKVIYANYERGIAFIEFIGEWNDCLYNDIMFLKRNVIEQMMSSGISKFVLIGENVLNFHYSDDSYYEEWFEELDDGWIAAINFRDFVEEEWSNYNIDSFVNFGGNLQITNWRTMKPQRFFAIVDELIQRRIALI